MKVRLLLGACAALAVVLGSLPASAVGPCTRLLVPAYFDESDVWDQMLASATGLRSVILNPASGPGATRDAGYAALADRAHAAGVQVLGYVDTNRGRRDAAAVGADIDRHREWYAVDGVFFDRAATDADQLAYYRGVASHARAAAAGVVALNPGSPPDAGYAEFADLIVTFEGSIAAHAQATAPAWMSSYPPAKFVHLVYGAGTVLDLWTAVFRARALHAGNVYVTPDTPPNPWDTLPRYWSLETTVAASRC